MEKERETDHSANEEWSETSKLVASSSRGENERFRYSYETHTFSKPRPQNPAQTPANEPRSTPAPPPWLAPQVRIVLALLCIAGLLAAWVVSANAIQRLQMEGDYDQPYFMAWFVHNGYVLFVVPWGLEEYFGGRSGGGSVVFPRKLVAFLMGPLNFLSFFCVYFWYLSVKRTDIVANTCIYQASSAFVFLLSVIFLKERVTFVKIAAVFLCFLGVVLIAGSSSDQKPPSAASSPTVWGYILCIASTFFYASFEVFYRKYGVDPQRPHQIMANTFRALTLMGISNLVLLSPGLYFLDLFQYEPFQIPSFSVLKTLCFLSLCDALYQCLLLCGILLTSPLFMSVGTLLSIPATLVVDVFAGSLFHLSGYSLGGIAVILVGFFGLNLSEFHQEEDPEDPEDSF